MSRASPEQTSRIARVNISTSGFSSGGAECRAGMVRQARARGPRTEAVLINRIASRAARPGVNKTYPFASVWDLAKHIHHGRTSRCVHGRSESVMPRTVAAAHTQCAIEHVIHDVISTEYSTRARLPRVHTRPCWARLTSLTSTTCMPCYVLSLAPSPPHSLSPLLSSRRYHAERDAAHFSQLGE